MADLIERQAAIDAFDMPLFNIMGRRNAERVVEYLQTVIQRIKELPSAQPEPSTEIQEILNYLDTTLHPIISPDNWNVYAELHDMVSKLPSEQPEHSEGLYVDGFNDGYRDRMQDEPRWTPFKLRPLTEEEQEGHPEWDCILDCKLPDDGQEILVTYDINGRRGVWYDEFCSDDGSYLDSGKEIGEEVIAWMPLPEPWRGEEK